jgi:precorrin-8X/cobalt-precorrin-8 methylmutase
LDCAQVSLSGIAVIGNALTVLVTLYDLMKQGEVTPGVGCESSGGFCGGPGKQRIVNLMSTPVPYITVPGTKGGSTIAVAIMNVFLKFKNKT